MGPPPRDITLGQKGLIDMSDKLWSLPVYKEKNLGGILLHDQKKECSYLKEQHTNALLNQILLLKFEKTFLYCFIIPDAWLPLGM